MCKSWLSFLHKIKSSLVVAAFIEFVKWLWGHGHDLILPTIGASVIGIGLLVGSVWAMVDTLPNAGQLLVVALFFLVVYGVFFYGSVYWIGHRRMNGVAEAFKEVVLDEHGIVISDEAARRLARNAVWGSSRKEAQMIRKRGELAAAERLLKESGKYDVQRRSPTTKPPDSGAGDGGRPPGAE